MSSFPRASARLASLSLIAALAITLLPGGAPRPVAAVSPDLVISQVYGAGGNTNALYQRRLRRALQPRRQRRRP